MTAHVRIDPVTQEMFVYGYEADGLVAKTMSYWICDKDGTLVSEQFFDAPHCSIVHDFVITEIMRSSRFSRPRPTPEARQGRRPRTGLHHYDLPNYIGVMPRYGDVSEMRWFKGPAGASSFHYMNAFETPVTARSISIITAPRTIAFPFIQADSGINVPMPGDERCGFQRWTMDLNSDAMVSRSKYSNT